MNNFSLGLLLLLFWFVVCISATYFPPVATVLSLFCGAFTGYRIGVYAHTLMFKN